MKTGYCCWECGASWEYALNGVLPKVLEGNDPNCRHDTLHAIPARDLLLEELMS